MYVRNITCLKLLELTNYYMCNYLLYVLSMCILSCRTVGYSGRGTIITQQSRNLKFVCV